MSDFRHPLLDWIMSEQIFEHLEHQVDRLIERCQHLSEENQQLQQENQKLLERETEWRSERARLLQARDNTQSRVEAMISRLKAMEHS